MCNFSLRSYSYNFKSAILTRVCSITGYFFFNPPLFIHALSYYAFLRMLSFLITLPAIYKISKAQLVRIAVPCLFWSNYKLKTVNSENFLLDYFYSRVIWIICLYKRHIIRISSLLLIILINHRYIINHKIIYKIIKHITFTFYPWVIFSYFFTCFFVG